MESNLSSHPFLIAGVESCGAAARGWPTASAVGLGIENLSREAEKESHPGPNSVAPDRAFREGAWFPTAHAVGYHIPPLRGGHIELRMFNFLFQTLALYTPLCV